MNSRSNKMVVLAGVVVMLCCVSSGFAANIALQTYGGTSFVSDGQPRQTDGKNSQWNSFDGSTGNYGPTVYNGGTLTFQRSWLQDVTLNTVTIYPHKGSGSSYDIKEVMLQSYRSGAWQTDQTWTTYPGMPDTLTYTYSGGVTAQSVRVQVEAGTKWGNQRAGFKDIDIDGTLSGSAITPTNLALSSFGGTMTSYSVRNGTTPADAFDGDTGTQLIMAPTDDQWVERAWDSAVTVSDILVRGGADSTSHSTQYGDIQYWDGSSWITAHQGNIYTYGDTGYEWGCHLDTAVTTTKIRLSNIDSRSNHYTAVSEIFVYGVVPEPTTIGLLLMGFVGFIRRK